jgi:hypothetical protein
MVNEKRSQFNRALWVFKFPQAESPNSLKSETESTSRRESYLVIVVMTLEFESINKCLKCFCLPLLFPLFAQPIADGVEKFAVSGMISTVFPALDALFTNSIWRLHT